MAARASNGLLRRMPSVLAPCGSPRGSKESAQGAVGDNTHGRLGTTRRQGARRHGARARGGAGAQGPEALARTRGEQRACERGRASCSPPVRSPSMTVQGRELLSKVLWMWGPACWPCAERASGQQSAPACPVCLRARHLYAMQTSLLLVGCGRRECGVPVTDWFGAPCML
jgi:hypothetical protein